MATIAENAKAQTTAEEKMNGLEQKAANGAYCGNGTEAGNGVNCEEGTKDAGQQLEEKVEQEKETAGKGVNDQLLEEEAKKEEVAVEVEPKTGVSFPVKLDDGKQLMSVGLRKKSMLGLGIKIYGFGKTLINTVFSSGNTSGIQFFI